MSVQPWIRQSLLRRRLPMICCALATLGNVPACAAPIFTDVTQSAGIIHAQGPIGPAAMTGGAAAGDYDNDGDVDLFFTRYGSADILYRNNANGTFTNVSVAAGFTQSLPTNAAAWGDVDNDGDLDLYVTAADTKRFYLYVNDGAGHFSEDAVARGAQAPAARNGAGVQQSINGQSVTFGDYDRDGFLDVFTGSWGGSVAYSGSRLLRNRGAEAPGFFEDVTAAVGLDVYRSTNTYRFTGQFTDLDRDGHTDLAIASDFGTSQLFWNNGDNTFVDGTLAAGVGTDQNGMGSAIADADGDGDLDWFVTAISQGGELGGNRLYLNNGDRTFTDGTTAAGVRNGGWAWGTGFLDFDNDGDNDLVATNGWNSEWGPDLTVFWQNNGQGTFADVTSSVVAGTPDNLSGRGLVHLDYDDDGDLDVVIVNNGDFPILYRNDGGNDGNFLRVKPIGVESNRNGIGALVTVTPDASVPEDAMIWEIDGGSSFLSQHDFTAHFGLGGRDQSIDKVVVEWPSGVIDVYLHVSPNTTLDAIEGMGSLTTIHGDFNLDGLIDAADLEVWKASFGHRYDGHDFLVWQRNIVGSSPDHTSGVGAVPEPSQPNQWVMLVVCAGLRYAVTSTRAPA